jgi:hypothetical protein
MALPSESFIITDAPQGCSLRRASEILDRPNVVVPCLSFERKVLPVRRGKRIDEPLAMAAPQQARDGAGGR